MPFPSDTTPDTRLFDLIDHEVQRQTTGLQLIASENFTSPAVMRAVGSALTNKYAEGYPGKRYYGGNAIVDDIEQLAIDRVKQLFGAEHANVQPHSGANANMCAYQAILEPGDLVLGLSLDHGGHLTHGSPVNASGKLYHFVPYKVSPGDERVDMDQVRDLALEHRPGSRHERADAVGRHPPRAQHRAIGRVHPIEPVGGARRGAHDLIGAAVKGDDLVDRAPDGEVEVAGKRLGPGSGFGEIALLDVRETGVFVPYAGVVYDLGEHYSVYASYSTIFKPQGERDEQGKALDPLEGRSYEMGLKAEFLDGRFNASAALFQLDQDNFAQPTGGKTPDGQDAYRA